MTSDQMARLYQGAAELRERGQFDEAVEQFEVILRLVSAEAGKIRVAQNYWDAALPFLEKAAHDLDNLDIQLLLARAYRLHRRFEDAFAPLRKRIERVSG
jgi:tetratricopeptide (TPR) repeat protein